MAVAENCQLIVYFPDSYLPEIRNPNSDIPMPDDLKGGKERMVFCNVEAIYEWHREYVVILIYSTMQSNLNIFLFAAFS